ncbi:MAG TPA: nucleotidyltransferase family protein [Thermodesulfobacteriota bacterium]|nr:nucleotidyltransferase family protein [Thermodesulfobacteriota bacterium]
MGKKIPIDVPYSRIEEFCQKWNIIELSLFGSALRDDFRPESDIDVLVTFAPETEISLSDFLNMEDELKQIFGREVDLVQRKSIERSENYIRRKHILNSLEVIYVAR